MLLTPENLNTNLFDHMKGLLVYGNDSELLSLIVWAVEFFAFQRKLKKWCYLDEGDFLKESSTYLSQDLFSSETGQKLVHVRAASEKRSSAWQDLFEKNGQDFFIFIQAPSLKKSSALLKWALKSPLCGVIACYENKTMPLKYQIIGKALQTLQKENIKGDNLNDQEIRMIAQDVDIVGWPHIFQKISLLINKEEKRGLKEIYNLIKNSSGEKIEELTPQLLFKQTKKVYQWVMLADSPLLSVRQALYFFRNMLCVRGQIESGQSFEKAIKNLDTPLFFKDANLMKKALFLWSQDKIYKALFLLVHAEISLKKGMPFWFASLYKIMRL